ncbi:MAG: hypothetical protein IPL28_05235 [Chloroflexi bacterium]|nr:hypothetical protein [Chloroflexota bacterium]
MNDATTRKNLTAVFTDFQAKRAQFIAFFKNLTDEEWERAASTPNAATSP